MKLTILYTALALLYALNATAYAQEPPVVTSITPSSGPEFVRTAVGIRGSNFQSGVTVTFGDRAATDVNRKFSFAIGAVSPAHPADTVDVIVTNPDGQADTLKNGFEFLFTLFGLPTSYPAGHKPSSVFSVDLDGDGDNDLAVANGGFGGFTPTPDSTVSVLMNNGDGTFAPKVDYPTGRVPNSVFSADLDGDGDNDLAVANSALFSFVDIGSISVLMNNGNGTFAPRVDYPAGDSPQSVFSVDLDGDGDNDLAVANVVGTVSVLFNNGDGTFADKVDYTTESGSNSVFSADLDGDGDNDLTVASGRPGNTVSVLMNNGDGTFAPKVDYHATEDPRSVFSADLDGDGDNDLAVANARGFSSRPGIVSVLLNNGDGTFAPKVDYIAGDRSISVFIADLDGDRDNDLAVANLESANVSVLLNNGDGTFAPKVDYTAGDGSISVFIADLDGDGDNDLVTAHLNGVSVLLNRSNVPLSPVVTSISPTSGTELGGMPVTITGSNFQSGATLTFGDMAATNVAVGLLGIITAKTPAHPLGIVDVIVTNPDGQADTLFSGFEFVLTGPLVVTSIRPGVGSESGGTPVTITGSTFRIGSTVTFGDMAGIDVAVLSSLAIRAVTPAHPLGTVDVIVTNPDGQTDTLFNGFEFIVPPPPVVTSISPTSGLELGGTSVTITGSNFRIGATVTFGDMAATDVVVVASNRITALTPGHPVGTVDVILTYPDGQTDTLFNAFEFIVPPPLVVTSIRPGVGSESGGTLVTITGSNFGIGATVTFGDMAAIDVVVVASNRITALPPAHPVGTVDVIVANADGKADTLENGFAFAFVFFGLPTDYATGEKPESVFSGDLDGDGDNDLAVANLSNDIVSVLLNDGDGKFAPKIDYPAGDVPQSVFIGDLDGDGDNDLAVANFSSDNVSILLNNGDGTFAPKIDYAAGDGPISVYSSDIDSDGDNDLAVANQLSNSVSVLLNKGDGIFPDRSDYAAGAGPHSIFASDLDGDGDNDLTVANTSSHNVSVLMNNGDETFADKVDYPTGNGPISVFVSDVDADGDNDIAVANFFNDNASVLLNHGDGTFAPKIDYDAGSFPRSVFIADLDGDEDNDMVVANSFSDNVSVFLNKGDGTFEDKLDFDAGDGPHSVFISDLDGDETNDLAVANWNSDNVSVLLNLSDISAVPPDLAADFDGNNEVGLADFVLFLDAFGTTTTSANSIFDLDGNGEIGLSDFVLFLDNFGRTQ